MCSHQDACTGAPSQPPVLPAQDQYVPHLHWQSDQPGLPEPVMQLGRPFADGQPTAFASHAQPSVPSSDYVAQAMPVAQHYVPHVHWQSGVVQPHNCNMPVGSQPMLPASFVNAQSMQPASHGQHDAQPHGCHMPLGGGQQNVPCQFWKC